MSGHRTHATLRLPRQAKVHSVRTDPDRYYGCSPLQIRSRRAPQHPRRAPYSRPSTLSMGPIVVSPKDFAPAERASCQDPSTDGLCLRDFRIRSLASFRFNLLPRAEAPIPPTPSRKRRRKRDQNRNHQGAFANVYQSYAPDPEETPRS